MTECFGLPIAASVGVRSRPVHNELRIPFFGSRLSSIAGCKVQPGEAVVNWLLIIVGADVGKKTIRMSWNRAAAVSVEVIGLRFSKRLRRLGLFTRRHGGTSQ
jgi:hypothetical protein